MKPKLFDPQTRDEWAYVLCLKAWTPGVSLPHCITLDDYIRTTEEEHERIRQELLRRS